MCSSGDQNIFGNILHINSAEQYINIQEGQLNMVAYKITVQGCGLPVEK
jgi:hypothetical protein